MNATASACDLLADFGMSNRAAHATTPSPPKRSEREAEVEAKVQMRSVVTSPPRFELSGRTLISAAGLIAAVWLVTQLWPVIITITVALILVGTLNPIVMRLARHGLRRSLAVAVVVFAMAIIAIGFALVTAPALGAQLSQMAQSVPRLQARLAEFLAGYPATSSFAEGVREFKPDDIIAGVGQRAVLYSSKAALVLGYGGTAVALAVYLLLDPERAQGSLFSVVPRRFHVRLARILLNLETIVGGYMRGQVLTSLLMTIFVFALLSACRVPNPLALAVFAGLADVIPLIGGLVALTPVVISALPRGTAVTLTVLLAMIVYQEFENRVIIPRVYGRVLRLSAATVTVALLIGGQLLGILGALLALPLAAALRMVVQELRVELPGENVPDSQALARDELAEHEYQHLAAGAPAKEAAAIAVQIAGAIRKQDLEDTGAQGPAQVQSEVRSVEVSVKTAKMP